MAKQADVCGGADLFCHSSTASIVPVASRTTPGSDLPEWTVTFLCES
jgi:hypothetical protein